VETPSRVAIWARFFALAGLALLLIGPLLCQLGFPPMLGFTLFGPVAILCGLLAVVLGALGLWRTRAASGLGGRGRAVAGALLGVVVLAVIVGAGALTSIRAVGSAELPRINDITTDPADPPAFAAILRLEGNAGRDMAYPGESFAAQQRAGYPDLAPIRLARPPGQAFQDVRRVAGELGWEIVAQDPMAGRIEATDTTRVFRFVDDVVVRIRPVEGGSLVDVRSKSRDGRGDLGANAARIRAFAEALGS
jgi:uncharacterized protein (DUF1499 family)